MNEARKVETIGTLYPRGAVMWWKVKVPSELSELPKYCKPDGTPKQNAANVSLGTANKREAQRKAVELAAKWSAIFDADRSALIPQDPELLAPALIEAIALRVRHAVLADDERLRHSPLELAQSLAVWWRGQERLRRLMHDEEHPERPYVPRSMPHELTPDGMMELNEQPSWLGIPPSLLEVLRKRHAMAAKQAREEFASGRFSPVVLIADREAQALGVNLGSDVWLPTKGGAAPSALHVACKDAYLAALDDLAKRDDGAHVATPEKPQAARKTSPKGQHAKAGGLHKLSDVFDKWKTSGDNPGAGTIRKKAIAVSLYEEFTKNTPIELLTSEQGADFSGWLLGKCRTEKTAKDYLDNVKSLLNKATVAGGLGWIPENPWQGHKVRVKKSSKRRPWTSANLVKLFDSELFKSYALPTIKSAGGAAAYWVPLLGIYTGARQSELCQLRLSDVVDGPDGLAVHITSEESNEEEGTSETSTKTAQSLRRVPVHSELLRLGFKDYVDDLRKGGQVQLC